jgi:hypothetical protein
VKRTHSVLVSDLDPRLIEPGMIRLRRLGAHRAHLIDSTNAHYPETRERPNPLSPVPGCSGLRWTSRQGDLAQAIPLFGPRVVSPDLVIAGPPYPMLADDIASESVINLAGATGNYNRMLNGYKWV